MKYVFSLNVIFKESKYAKYDVIWKEVVFYKP